MSTQEVCSTLLGHPHLEQPFSRLAERLTVPDNARIRVLVCYGDGEYMTTVWGTYCLPPGKETPAGKDTVPLP